VRRGSGGVLGSAINDETLIGDSAKGRYQSYRASLIGIHSKEISVPISVHVEHPSCSRPDLGKATHFESSIYWSDRTCAHIVQGQIRDFWIKLGAQASKLGYPTSDELATPDGLGRRSQFEHGEIRWYPDKGAYLVAEPTRGSTLVK